METFRSDYILFFRELQKFVDLLLQGCKEEVLEVLRDVKVVLTVLPEDDIDFVNTNLANVIDKFEILKTVTLAVVAKISLLVREEYRGTLENLPWDLQLEIVRLEMTLASLKISGISPRVSSKFCFKCYDYS